MCSCIKGIVKCLITIINIAFFVVGGVMLGVGIWLLVDDAAFTWFNDLKLGVEVGPDDPLWITVCSLIIGIGAFLFVIGFTGCCGVRNGNSCLLCTYIILVSVCIALEVTVIIMAVVFNSQVGGRLGDAMKDSVQDVYGPLETDNDPTTVAWNRMQFDMGCCGSRGFADWEGSKFDLANPQWTVPFTCCIMDPFDGEEPLPGDVRNRANCESQAQGRELQEDEQNELHRTGCADAMRDTLQQNMYIVIGICAAIILLQILGLIVACNAKDEAQLV